NHQKNTNACFYQIMDELYNFKDVHGNQSPLVSKELCTISRDMSNYIEPMFDFSRDYLIDYFGFKTLERAYLFKNGDKIVETDELYKQAGFIEQKRYKGLGEMDGDQLFDTTMDPEKRVLIKVEVEDAEKADAIFNKLMGTEVELRKNFIQTHAKFVKDLDI
ncbi:hypothetical protein EBR37_03325, partial [bacterium]|nr:hypothetical protein [bacterium]